MCYSNISSRRFRHFYLTFGTENCNCLPFGNGIFRRDSTIKSPYGISTTHSLWSPINYHSGRNIAPWQTMSFVSHITSIWFLPMECVAGTLSNVISLTKYYINNCVRALDILPSFRSSLSSIIKMILSPFCFHFLISHTSSSMNNIMGHIVYPFDLYYLLCRVYTVPRTMGSTKNT